MFKEDGYFIVNSLEEEKALINILDKNNYKYIGGSSNSFNNGKRPYLNLYVKSKEYDFLHTTFSRIHYKIEEKRKLFTLLYKLGYTTNFSRYYNNVELDDDFYNINRYCRTAKGTHALNNTCKEREFNIIYFSDLKYLITE